MENFGDLSAGKQFIAEWKTFLSKLSGRATSNTASQNCEFLRKKENYWDRQPIRPTAQAFQSRNYGINFHAAVSSWWTGKQQQSF